MIHADVFKEDDGKAITRVGTLVGKKFEITTTQGGRKSKRTVDVPKDTLAHQRGCEDGLGAERKPGESLLKCGVTWEEADIDQKETYLIKGAKETVLAGVKTRLPTVEVEADGAKMPSEVFPDGKVFTAEV